MKVLIVTYKADISGGSNRAMLEVIDTIIEQGHEVYLLVPRKNGELFEEAAKRKITCKYLHYSRVGIAYPSSKVKVLFNLIKMELKLIHDWFVILGRKREFKKQSFDIVYTNGSATHFGRMLSKQLNIPHIWHIREFFGEDQLLPLRAYQRMNDRTDKFIVISSALKELYDKKLGAEKVVKIFDGMSVPPYHNKVKHDGFKILLAGRIAPAKRQLDAVKGFECFKKLTSDADAQLYLAGSPVTEEDHRYQKTIENYVQKNNLNNSIIFLGQINDMAKLRSEMDIELMCSEREPFGRVTVEGMRAGLPVIGTASGGTLDIIKENVSGLFYQPGNFQELGEKIYSLYSNPKYMKELSESAKQYGQTHFTEKQLLLVVELMEQTIRENQSG